MPSSSSHSPELTVVIGGTRESRAAAVGSLLQAGPQGPARREVHAAALWPYQRHIVPHAPSAPSHAGPILLDGPSTIWLRDLHLAFPPQTTPGIRLVLHQSTYQLQRLLDWLDVNPGREVIADADDRIRSEPTGRRGPWARIRIVDLGLAGHEAPLYEAPPHQAREIGDDAAMLLHRATSSLEEQRGEEALALLEEALRQDPTWEATHFEIGKLWLRAEETERAAAAFTEAGRLMPTFAAAFSNLGAALGELERSDQALLALEQALRHDPYGFPVLNNIGAVKRELGRLEEAEAAFRQVIDLAPSFVFGHYNLGHTLFLQGRFADARSAYEEGVSRDPQKNARQGCRLAVARAAAGDAAGAIDQFRRVSESVPVEVMKALAGEAERALVALSTLPSPSPSPSPSLNSSLRSVELPRILDEVRRYTS